jgi:hypothetical protein
MARAATDPLPQMLDVENAAALVYACEGQHAIDLFAAMELVSNQTIEDDEIIRRAGNVVCSNYQSHRLVICTLTLETTLPFAKQAR